MSNAEREDSLIQISVSLVNFFFNSFPSLFWDILQFRGLYQQGQIKPRSIASNVQERAFLLYCSKAFGGDRI